ncbi:hypothetical protein [Flavobacterium seoulense]|uniref:Uncharacterized protein n=1 Tax=Flavobacterium seoulense TaxID=1492738 RepID=A0A066WU91_9FLAO|nr:hypothetical protein [Flavobacterium seoulense]KDN54534.1 hypothetical protein FEM21_22570 [Flavobacterium seoulense]
MKNKIIFLSLIFFLNFSLHAQKSDWTKTELLNYKTLANLATYVSKHKNNKLSKEVLFKNYIYFDYVLNDTVVERKESRIQHFDSLFSRFKNIVNRIGIKNLDAKPVRFYKNNEVYKPFENELQKTEKNVFVYFDKRKPHSPLGTLLFEEKSNKLIAWILLNQGGYHYFLTFNLL